MTQATTRPVPITVLTVMAGGVLALTVLGTFSVTSRAYADWTAVSALTRESQVYTGPWVAAWCAWIAGRYLGPRSMLCLPSAARSGTRIVTAHAVVITAGVLAGFAAGLAPVLWSTGHRATYGSLDWLVLGGSVAVLLTFCSVGYLIGCALPRAASVIAAATAAFAIILLAETWGPVVTPLRLGYPTSVGLYETGTVAAFRIVFFTVLACALVVAAARIVADRTITRSVGNYVGLAVLVVPLLLGGVARAAGPDAVVREARPPASCTRAGSVPTCVHPAKAVLLPALATAVDRVLASVDDKPAVPLTGVSDEALGRTPGPDVLVLDLQTDDENWTGWAAADVAGYISGQQACNQRGDISGEVAEAAIDQHDVSDGITAWLTQAAGYTAPQSSRSETADHVADTFTRLPPIQARQLYQRFAPQIAACQLSSSALP